jgi:hypothetical protein
LFSVLLSTLKTLTAEYSTWRLTNWSVGGRDELSIPSFGEYFSDISTPQIMLPPSLDDIGDSSTQDCPKPGLI